MTSPVPVYPLSPLYRLHLVLFPATCRLCGAILVPASLRGAGYPFLCDGCWQKIPWIVPERSCRQCAAPTAEPQRRVCPSCAGRAWALDGVRAACDYEEPVRRWLLQLKFMRRVELTRMLGLLLAIQLSGPAGPPPEALLVPVPLHRKRLRKRGFNQSYLLAHAWQSIARRWGQPPPELAPGLLQRHRHTRPQLEIAAAERTQNVAGAFSTPASAVRPGGWRAARRGVPSPADRHVVLVDDIMTTGATLDACARALKEAGAASVHAVVLARA